MPFRKVTQKSSTNFPTVYPLRIYKIKTEREGKQGKTERGRDEWEVDNVLKGGGIAWFSSNIMNLFVIYDHKNFD